ncbi:MAG TPA: ATP-binding protein [Candidatus Ozemobacteraceae bacterium]|nr:ATP-binding protein [Candidatus Ozemobacteraceae bacterium]
MRRFGLSQRVILGSLLVCVLMVAFMGIALRRFSSVIDATAHLRVADDVLLVGSQVQNDLLELFQTSEIFDQYISDQTWRHYFSFSQRVDTLLDRAKELRQFRKQGEEFAVLDRTRLEMAELLQNATYTINPNFPVGAVSSATLQRIKAARTRLHEQIRELLKQERENRKALDGIMRQQIESMSRTMLWVAALVLAAGLLFAFYLHRAAMAPLRSLMDIMRTSGEPGKVAFLEPAGAPEMRELIDSFNQMNTAIGRQQKRLSSMLQLAVTVAHEVRNPVAAIGTAIQALQNGYPADGPDREIFAEILKEVYRVNGIISDLLVFARPRSLNPERMKWSELMDELRILLRSWLEERRIVMNIDIPPGLDEAVADRNQLHRALLNLLTNAIDAVDRDGRIEIFAEACPAGVRIVVEDSGPGIPAERLERIFDPFFTTKTKGTGLGLAIVSGIVESHGGTVRAATGRRLTGARFELELPREVAPASVGGTPSPSATSFSAAEIGSPAATGAAGTAREGENTNA